MVLGSPAAVWGTFITVIEGISGDLSSDEAKEAKKKRDKWQEEKKGEEKKLLRSKEKKGQMARGEKKTQRGRKKA